MGADNDTAAGACGRLTENEMLSTGFGTMHQWIHLAMDLAPSV